MFIRRKPNKSGSISVQLIEKRGGRNIVLKTVGCARDESTLRKLELDAKQEQHQRSGQLDFDFGLTASERAALEVLQSGRLQLVGPELVLGKIFDSLGFSSFAEPLFRDIVLARLAYPTSKLGTAEYLFRHQGKEIEVNRIYRFLDRLSSKYKEQAEQIAFNYSKQTLGSFSAVFYDVTTLYFEAESEDDLRKIGFSKDGKFQHPQIMLGLLVGNDGYPVGYDVFEGNTFEGHTLIPVLEKAQNRFGFSKPRIIADSALLSKENLKLLRERGYEFVIGARIKNESIELQQQILSACKGLEDNNFIVMPKSDGSRIIIDYSSKRAKKDASNRKKGVDRLTRQVRSGRLTKENLNKRGYNKFLTLDGNIKISIDQSRIEEDAKWDGLKGYVTNASIDDSTVISNYRQLWKIEKAFRISKTDLRIRPIYHRKKQRILAHVCIAFVAYTILKELERLLLTHKTNITPQKAIQIMNSIYQVTVFLPDSKCHFSSFLNLTEEQKQILSLKINP